MTDTAPDIVEITPAEVGLNPMTGDGPAPEAEQKPESVEEKPKEKPSLDDTLKKAFKASEEKSKEPVEKPAKEVAPKAEAKPVEESVAEKPAADEKVRAEKKPSEGRKFESAPSRFIPEASAKWANVPNEVKSEIHRAFEDFEREKQTYSEHVKFREELKEYEDLGKQHNVTIKQALENYVGIERKFAADPAEGFKQLFSNLNMQPQQAISHILRAFNVSPHALAQHISENPNSYVSQMRQPAPVQQQQNPLEQKIAQLEERLNTKEQEQVISQTMPIIQRFADDHPDYYHLQDKIAEILKSGIIDKIHGDSLSADKKLSEAYRMAGGSEPASRYDNTEDSQLHSRAEKRPVNPDAGKLSIGGSPNAGDIKSTTRKKAAPSIDDALANAIRRAS